MVAGCGGAAPVSFSALLSFYPVDDARCIIGVNLMFGHSLAFRNTL